MAERDDITTTVSENPELNTWVSIATENLCQEAKERIAGEIQAHYHDGLDALAGEGGTSESAHDRVMEGLGDPEKAHKAFSRTYLTSWQAEFLSKLRKRSLTEKEAAQFLESFNLLSLMVLPLFFEIPVSKDFSILGVLLILFCYLCILTLIFDYVLPRALSFGYTQTLKPTKATRGSFMRVFHARFPVAATVFILTILGVHCVNMSVRRYFAHTPVGPTDYPAIYLLFPLASHRLHWAAKDFIFFRSWPTKRRQNIVFAAYLSFLLLLLCGTVIFMLDLCGVVNLHLSAATNYKNSEVDAFMKVMCTLLFGGALLFPISEIGFGMYFLRKAGTLAPAPEPDQETISDTNTPGCA